MVVVGIVVVVLVGVFVKVFLFNVQLVLLQIECKVDVLLVKMILVEKIGQFMQYNDQGFFVFMVVDFGVVIVVNLEICDYVDVYDLVKKGEFGLMFNVIGVEKICCFQEVVMYSWLGILILFGVDVIYGYCIIYLVLLGLFVLWDLQLVEDVLCMLVSEVIMVGVKWFYLLMVDILCDVCWGCFIEGVGEDVYLGLVMVCVYICGYQGIDLFKFESVVVLVKYFVVYGVVEVGCEYNIIDMFDICLCQVYLLLYKVVVEVGVVMMMSLFNVFNGVLVIVDLYLMDEILCKEWGFDGFVVSDYIVIMELIYYGIVLDVVIVMKKVLEVGVEVDMMSYFYDIQILKLLKEGKFFMVMVDEVVCCVLWVKFVLGLFEYFYVCGIEVIQVVDVYCLLVCCVVEELFVLLKNGGYGQLLVLLLFVGVKKFVLIGLFVDDVSEMQGVWGGVQYLFDVVMLCGGLVVCMKKVGGELLYVKGIDVVIDLQVGFVVVKQVVVQVDVVVMVLGEFFSMSGEVGLCVYLDLLGNQQQLFEVVVVIGKLVVLLVFFGCLLVFDWVDQYVGVIMEIWFFGIEVGNVVVNVLFGDVVFSGKLIMSFLCVVGQELLYYNQFLIGCLVGDVDLSKLLVGDMCFILCYIDVFNDVFYLFGYGFSYIMFGYLDVVVLCKQVLLVEVNCVDVKSLVIVIVMVKNIGKCVGIEVVQLYVCNFGVSVEQLVCSLQGFQWVMLKVGELRQVIFQFGFLEFLFYNVKSQLVVEFMYYIVWVGGSLLVSGQVDFDVVL